jgi:hypothetical protein
MDENGLTEVLGLRSDDAAAVLFVAVRGDF